MRSHQSIHQPENKRVRVLVMVICGVSLLLSGLLIWLNNAGYAVSRTGAAPALEQSQMASNQPTEAVKYLKPAEAGFVRLPVTPSASDVLADALLTRVQKLFATGDSEDRDFVFTNLLPALVKMNPDVAARFAESTKSDLLRADTLRTVAQTWGSLDSARAVNWAAQLPDVAERNLELGYVCNEIASTDPARAAQAVEQSGLGERTEAVLQNIAQKWAVQNFSDAKAWALAEPFGERRDTLLARIAAVRSVSDPADAARLIVDEIPAGAIQTEAVLSVIAQWGIRDMAGATAWVALFPPGQMKTHAEQQLSGIAAYQKAPPEDQN